MSNMWLLTVWLSFITIGGMIYYLRLPIINHFLDTRFRDGDKISDSYPPNIYGEYNFKFNRFISEFNPVGLRYSIHPIFIILYTGISLKVINSDKAWLNIQHAILITIATYIYLLSLSMKVVLRNRLRPEFTGN